MMDEPKETDRLTQLTRQTQEVKGIMTQNMELVMKRGEKIEHGLEKAEELSQASSQFKTTSKKLEKKLCWKNFKIGSPAQTWLVVVLLLLCIIRIIFISKQLWIILVIILSVCLGVIVIVIVAAVLATRKN